MWHHQSRLSVSQNESAITPAKLTESQKKDPRLAEKLRAELPGILRWALEGCLIWQTEGLTTPRCVIEATADYRAQEDLVGQFMEDRIVNDDTERTLQTSVYQSYQDWALGMGVAKPWSAAALNRKLVERGIAKTKINGARFWRGIAIA